MTSTELQSKVAIAAALITSRAVEVPHIPDSGHWWDDPAAVRLRDLTEYLYQVLAASTPDPN